MAFGTQMVARPLEKSDEGSVSSGPQPLEISHEGSVFSVQLGSLFRLMLTVPHVQCDSGTHNAPEHLQAQHTGRKAQ